jgi:hypothetical protein
MFSLIELHHQYSLRKDQNQPQLIIIIMLPSPVAEMLERNRYVRNPSSIKMSANDHLQIPDT